MTILVTGGAGFIGCNFIAHLLETTDERVVTLDALTYAGNIANLAEAQGNRRHRFVEGSILDIDLVAPLLAEHQIGTIVNFAAESHVDRSIRGPDAFIDTNITGTFRLLEAARRHVGNLAAPARDRFRFLQVSTDEVFGTLGPDDTPFNELTRYAPNSPYAASKAAADHLVRAWHETYGLATLISNCSNNYGPCQFPEKLIPLVIHNALAKRKLPIYGDGQQVRDWLFVGDHCRAITRILEAGIPGASYVVGGHAERTNLEIVETICVLLDRFRPRSDGQSYAAQIDFVADRPGHDRRYAIDATRICAELGWEPQESLQSGLERTVRWYLEHQDWVEGVTSGSYRDWVAEQYA